MRYKLNNKSVDFNIYPNTEALYKQLENIGIVDKIKTVPQLGCIAVNKKNRKYKYDYIMTQLYLADVLSKAVRTKLERSTGNKFEKINKVDFSVGDALQILIILNVIGHFNTTFVGSKAMIDACHENELSRIIHQSSECRK